MLATRWATVGDPALAETVTMFVSLFGEAEIIPLTLPRVKCGPSACAVIPATSPGPRLTSWTFVSCWDWLEVGADGDKPSDAAGSGL